MNSQTDQELLREYAWQHSEAAFTELVQRYLDLVYSAAVRMVLDRALAEDVTQAVFLALAQNAHKVQRCPLLSAWLHTTTRNLAAKAVRTEVRRHNREREAVTMSCDLSESALIWQQIAPHLDEVLGQLDEADRHALLLRYFEKKPYTAVGAALGLSENAARMRVDRALDKLRAQLSVRGITSTAAALSTALADHVVSIAPTTLGAQVVSHALAGAAKVATSSGTGLGMAGKLGVAAGIAVLVITMGIAVKHLITSKEPSSAAASAVGESDSRSGTNSAGSSAGKLKFTPRNVSAPQQLELFFVDDQTGRPITNEIISLRGWERGSQLLVEKKVPLEEGRCVAPFDLKYLTFFWILTRIDGYADTRLRWNTGRGEVVPAFYTVRLVRPVLLHGRVVDSSGNPVPGATVGFGSGDAPGSDTQPEDHGIEALRTTTDAAGRWEVHGVAPDALAHLGGSASHPYYTEARVNLGKEADAARQMLEGTFEFHLGEAGVVQGRVVDYSNQGIGNAVVRVGHLDESRSRQTRSRADGTFVVAGCALGEHLITADALGFAPTVQQVIIGSNLPPLTLTLTKGKALRIRVVDTQGQPLEKAGVWFYPFQGIVPQVSFHASTDAEGRAIWENAPDTNLTFRISAAKHIDADRVVIRPDDEEHVVTLSGTLTIAGIVRDADTGEVVPRFRLCVGWPQATRNTWRPYWSSINRPLYSKGEFRQELHEPAAQGRFIFRFEAEGYASETTRIYNADEGEVWIDVRLQKAEETTISVSTPNGAPAAGAYAALCERMPRIPIGPDGFRLQPGQSIPGTKRADADGKFSLPKDKSIIIVVIAHAAGYAEAAADELQKARTISLSPWSRVEGAWRTNGQPVANAQVSLRRVWPETNEPRVMGDEFTFTRTDGHGNYRFPQVPPGAQYDLQRWNTTSFGSSAGPRLQLWTSPGETNWVMLGDAFQQ